MLSQVHSHFGLHMSRRVQAGHSGKVNKLYLRPIPVPEESLGLGFTWAAFIRSSYESLQYCFQQAEIHSVRITEVIVTIWICGNGPERCLQVQLFPLLLFFYSRLYYSLSPQTCPSPSKTEASGSRPCHKKEDKRGRNG